MKKPLRYKLIIALATCLLASVSAFGQTKVIPAQLDGNQVPIADILIDEIVADTNAAGEQLNSVYQLEAGGIYTLTRTMVLNNSITIEGPDFDRTSQDAADQPPQIRIADDGNGAQACNSDGGGSCFWILAGADVTLRNIYFGGIHLANGWTSGNLLRPAAADVSITFDNLIIDYMGWSVIANFDPNITGVSYYILNTYVKNAQNVGDLNSPFLILNTVPLDSVVIRNSTYFQSHGFFLQSRVPHNYIEINHSTIANALKSPIFNEHLTNARITNNIWFNTTGGGFSAPERADQDPDGLEDWGIVNVDTLTDGFTITEAERNVIVRNNVWFKSPELLDFMADSLVTGGFFNERTQAMFDNDADWPGLVAENNQNLEIIFDNITEPGTGINAVQEMIDYVSAFRSGESVDFWGFEADENEFGANAELVMDWPLSEDLAHNITAVTDGNGDRVGDLNWFGVKNLPVSNEEQRFAPNSFELAQNFPNPFNPSTSISFNIPAAQQVNLDVFNILGQKVATLVNGRLSAGAHLVNFDASGLSSGVYIYRLQAGSQVTQKSMTLIK